MSDKFSDAPDSKPYYELWGKHEFGMHQQRNVLLHFIHEKELDDEFLAYLDRHAPENPETEEREIRED